MDELQKLFPQAELGFLCKKLALEVNDFARSQPSLSVQEQERINLAFSQLSTHEANSNIARLHDECVLAALQAAGAGVHAIGEVLEKGVNVPFVPSILARTTAENCSIVRYLCAERDPIRRVARAINAFQKNLADSGAADPANGLNEVFQGIQELQQQLPKLGISKRDKLPVHYKTLVETYLAEFNGAKLYDELSRSTHYNLVSQVEMITYAEQRTPHNYVAIYDRSLFAAQILIYSVQSALPFRAECSDSLKTTADVIVRKNQMFDSYCSYRNKQDAQSSS